MLFNLNDCFNKRQKNYHLCGDFEDKYERIKDQKLESTTSMKNTSTFEKGKEWIKSGRKEYKKQKH